MKKNIELLIIGCISLTQMVFAQKESKTFDVSNFKSIDVRVAAHVVLTKGDGFKCYAMGKTRHIDRLDIKVKGDELMIRTIKEDFWDFNEKEVDIFIEMPDLQGVHFSGAGNIESNSTWSGDKIRLEMSGAGSLNLYNLDYKTVKANMAGAGSMKLKGKATEIDMDMSGAGSIDALDLAAEKGSCDVSGIGKIFCDVSNDLRANVSGIGGIRYKNMPANLSKSVSGIGKVKPY